MLGCALVERLLGEGGHRRTRLRRLAARQSCYYTLEFRAVFVARLLSAIKLAAKFAVRLQMRRCTALKANAA